jgi:hypothetical protein
MKRTLALLAAAALVLGIAERQAAAQTPGFDPSVGYGYVPDGGSRLTSFAQSAPPASPQPVPQNGVNGLNGLNGGPQPAPAYSLPEEQAEFFGSPGGGVSWQVIGDYLYIRPSNAEVAYAQVSDTSFTPPLPNGRTALTNPFYDTGFRVSAARALGDGASIGVSYMYFDNSVHSEIDAVAPNQVISLVLYPGAPTLANPGDFAVANENIRFHVADIDYKVSLVSGPRYCASLVAGARYVLLDQGFDSVLVSDVPGVGLLSDQVISNVKFEGGGIRAGFEGERQSPSSGFLVYGKSTASLVAGTFRADYSQFNTDLPTLVDTQWKSNRVLTILDLEVGAGWASTDGRLRVTGGWMVSAWFNTIKLSDYIHAVQNMASPNAVDPTLPNTTLLNFNIDHEVTKPLMFDGLVGRVEWRF